MAEEPRLFVHAAAVAGERSVRPDHPMAGHDDADGIVVIGPAHSPNGLRFPDAFRLLAIGDRFPIGNKVSHNGKKAHI